MVASVFGRYRVEAELGRGGMGVVYRAHDPELDREVAVKHIELPADASREARDELEKRFRREAKAAARIRHPGVVAIHDVGTTERGLYLVMELVDGESLARRLDRGAFLDRAAALEVAARAADALGAAHRAGVVHRDVKPANILIAGDGRVMLTDFGVARSLDEVSELTRTGMVVGSPAYMAPEQLRGSPVDGRADLFSLGVVLYELLLRKRPFPATSITTLLYQILHEDPLADPAIARELDLATAHLLRRLLAKQPEERFADAAAAAAAMRQLPLEGPRDDEAMTRVQAFAAAAPLPHQPPVPPQPAVAPPLPDTLPGIPGGPSAATAGPSGRTFALLFGGTIVAALVVVGALLALWNRTPQLPIVQVPRPSGWTPAGEPLPEGSLPPAAATPTPLPLTAAPGADAAATPLAAPTAEETGGVEPAPPPATPPPAILWEPPPAATPSMPPSLPPSPPAAPREEPVQTLRCRRGVEFDVDPEEAEVYVDGERVGTVDELGEYAPRTPGRHLFRFAAQGYKSATVAVEISPDADDKWVDLELELEEQR